MIERRRMMMKEDVDYSLQYFTLKALQDGAFQHTSFPVDYSVDGGNTWTTLSAGSSTPTVQAGTKVMFRGNITPSTSNGVGTFTGTNYFVAEGNVMSLLYGDNFVGEVDLTGKIRPFYDLLRGASYLKSAKNLSLPATTLTAYCYCEMFYGCTSLTTAPELLPATTLAQSCYSGMFNGCTSLTAAPELPATTLANTCYSMMFNGCTSLTAAPELPATTLANMCYNNMFYGTNVLPDCTNIDFSSQSVVASGGLRSLFAGTKITDAQLDAILKEHGINNYSLPVTTLANSCYQNMFKDCTSLTTAPELPATTLANTCYSMMFRDCTSLSSIKCLATNISATNCTANWVRGISASGTFTKAASMNDWTEGVNGVPSGWTVVDAA